MRLSELSQKHRELDAALASANNLTAETPRDLLRRVDEALRLAQEVSRFVGAILGAAGRTRTSGEPAPASAEGELAEAIVAGAVYDFLGRLTSVPGKRPIGAAADASPFLDTLETWARERGLDTARADVMGWGFRLAALKVQPAPDGLPERRSEPRPAEPSEEPAQGAPA